MEKPLDYFEESQLSEDPHFDIIILPVPTLTERFKSILIDSLVLVAMMMIFSMILSSFEGIKNWVRVTCFALVFLYEPIFVAHSATIGQRIMNIKVVDFEDYVNADKSHSINILFSLFRYISKLLLGWISLITVSFDADKRAIHDLFSGSVMLKVRKNKH